MADGQEYLHFDKTKDPDVNSKIPKTFFQPESTDIFLFLRKHTKAPRRDASYEYPWHMFSVEIYDDYVNTALLSGAMRYPWKVSTKSFNKIQ